MNNHQAKHLKRVATRQASPNAAARFGVLLIDAIYQSAINGGGKIKLA